MFSLKTLINVIIVSWSHCELTDMNCPTVLLLFLLTSSQTAGLCQLDWACSSVNFVLGQVDNITTVSQCRAECVKTEGCEFFTFYNSSATAGGGQ